MTEAITPQEIRDWDQDEKVRLESIEFVVDMINKILTLPSSITLLRSGEAVKIFDRSDSPQWNIGHTGAISRFKFKGWVIEEVPPEQWVPRPVYLFKLGIK